MIVFLNGTLVPESEARVSVFDRGFLYADGLFETLLVRHGTPLRWQAHLERFHAGLELMKLKCPFTDDQLRAHAAELLCTNNLRNGVLRLQVTRGAGPRGYSPNGADTPTCVMTAHAGCDPLPGDPAQWTLITSSLRMIAGDPLATIKSSNKLRQVLARMEADEQGANDALLLNEQGHVTETSAANVFCLVEGRLRTPPLSSGVLPGITRQVLMDLAASMGIRVMEETITPACLRMADAVLLTLSTLGVVEAVQLDGMPLNRSALVPRLHAVWLDLVERETRQPHGD